MESLSWIFFCLSPFALFCSENGTGLILCPVFIILGFICKYAGNNPVGTSGNVVKVNPSEFWEWHYKDCMRSTLDQKDTISDGLMARKDKEARSWATTICGYHNAPVPSEGTQEQIARANGVITEKMVKEKKTKKDRIQVGKYFLMSELEKKYESTRIGKKGYRNYCFPRDYIEKDKDRIKSFDNDYITEYWAWSRYKKSIKEIVESLSAEEMKQVERWVEEYEDRLIKMCNEYVCEDRCSVKVRMDF